MSANILNEKIVELTDYVGKFSGFANYAKIIFNAIELDDKNRPFIKPEHIFLLINEDDYDRESLYLINPDDSIYPSGGLYIPSCVEELIASGDQAASQIRTYGGCIRIDLKSHIPTITNRHFNYERNNKSLEEDKHKLLHQIAYICSTKRSIENRFKDRTYLPDEKQKITEELEKYNQLLREALNMIKAIGHID